MEIIQPRLFKALLWRTFLHQERNHQDNSPLYPSNVHTFLYNVHDATVNDGSRTNNMYEACNLGSASVWVRQQKQTLNIVYIFVKSFYCDTFIQGDEPWSIIYISEIVTCCLYYALIIFEWSSKISSYFRKGFFLLYLYQWLLAYLYLSSLCV